MRQENKPAKLEVQRVLRCPMCCADRRSGSISAVHDWFFRAASGNWNYDRCANCQSLYLDPRPTDLALPDAYRGYYTHQIRSPQSKPETAGIQWRKRVANTLINSRFGFQLTPALPARIPHVVARVLTGNKLGARYRHFPKLPREARVLDVGCGSGQFMAKLNEAGVRVYGVDFDQTAVDAANNLGLDAVSGDITAAKAFGIRFNAITMNHVIEHVPDVCGTLKSAADLMVQGGFLHLEYPNPAAPSLHKFGKYWRGLEAPRHICIPSEQAIKQVLLDVGFSKVSFITMNPDPDEHMIEQVSLAAATKNEPDFLMGSIENSLDPTFLRVLAWK